MRLDLERDRPAIADIDYAGVFLARFHQNVWSSGWKFFQFTPRVFVGTMLAPHHRKNSELSEVRLASENFFDASEFLRRQAVLRNNLRRDFRIGGRHWKHED